MSPTYEHPEAIVSTEWLANNLENPSIRIFECTVYLRYTPADQQHDRPYDVEIGRADYESGHIPGAAFIDLQAELSDNSSPPHLRFTLPSLDELAKRFMAIGVDEGSRVIIYSREKPQWATRVWWMLRAVGFHNAAVLDGGFDAWAQENRATSKGTVRFPIGKFHPSPNEALFTDRASVQASINAENTCTVNALDAGLHRGEDGRYGRPGRIPGSVNVPASALIDTDSKRFKAPSYTLNALEAVGAKKNLKNIVYCGGGIAATLDAFLMYQLGYPNVAVYDASMSEWAKDGSLPVESDV